MARQSEFMARRRPRRIRWVVLIVAALAAVGLPAAAPAAPAPAATWLCRPDTGGDPCDLPSDTTDLRTGATTAALPGGDRPVDCFYVYPTVSNDIALGAPATASPEVRSIARFQAARFGSVCRVYSPVYRQVPILGLGPALLGAGALFDTGYADVVAAWRDYLARDNDGRGVIFVGHSQGTMILRRLLREHVDPDPAVRDRVVGAFLMGGNVTAAENGTTGGDFAHLPLCTAAGEAGCVVAYSTDTTATPSIFGASDLDLLSGAMGLPHGPGFRVACTDPVVLAGDTEPVGLTVPSDGFSFGFISVLLDITALPSRPPTSASTWTTGRARGTGECVDPEGFHRYRIALDGGDPLNELPLMNTHLADLNFGLDRLVGIAARQSATWQAGRPA
ncbi:DUF3089 domain-containing protein [Nocardia thailandica]|uniref:DUF3089 domain-containing protein n=1 Tax=Nocardia thailandica TaxID=257275 RepID=UPI00031E80F1|nr:DUF3089 domain-containing protein [Nocardia thailandica]